MLKLFRIAVVFPFLLAACSGSPESAATNNTQTPAVKTGDTLSWPAGLAVPVSPLDSTMAQADTIALDDYAPASAILNRTGSYSLMLVKQKNGDEIRAVTFAPDLSPIESLLLYFRTGNNEYKIARAHSDKNPVSYKNGHFTFTDTRYDTEWEVYPTKGKDVLTLHIEYTVRVDDNGKFVAVDQKNLLR